MLHWTAITAGLLTFILLPFVLFDEPVSTWTLQTIRANPEASFLWIALALALDTFLPIPSSIVSTMAGALLGFPLGIFASSLGLSVGSVLGYWFGASVGRKAVSREQAFVWQERFGSWALVLARPIPVLAEASVIAAGFSRVPFGRFLLVTTLSNIGISAAYAYAGALAAGRESFLLVFAGAVAIPGVALLLSRILSRNRPKP